VTDKRRERTDRAVDKVRGMSKGQYRANKDRREEESAARSRRRDKERVEDKKEKDERERRHQGFGAGLKSALGGDALSRDKKTREKARTEAGKKFGKFVRNAPGNVAKGAYKGAKFLGKGALGIARANAGVSTGTSSSAPSTSGVSKVND
jgi:hypothetical protein